MCLVGDEEEQLPWSSDPESMSAIDQALQLESYAPQWQPGSSRHPSAAVVIKPDKQQAEQVPPQRLESLRQDELATLESLPEASDSVHFSELEQSLLRRSLESLDYLGDWADPRVARDSIVLCCDSPEVRDFESGPEFTCGYDDFTQERHLLHTHIIERMLTIARTTSGSRADLQRMHLPPASDDVPSAAADGSSAGDGAGSGEEVAGRSSPHPQKPNASAGPATSARPRVIPGGPPALRVPLDGERHVYIVVGVPGSGKDTVLKRYLRSLGPPLLDASADLVKEYLAAWGQDELSRQVRENNACNGPGKHLLHAQYLHRESILLVDKVVERALAMHLSILLEKTLFNLEPVVRCVRQCQAAGCRVHLLGTHIQPLRNWAFLSARMASGQAFGRYITRDQASNGLRRYQANLERLLNDESLLRHLDSVHVYDVMADAWCVSLEPGGVPPPNGFDAQRAQLL